MRVATIGHREESPQLINGMSFPNQKITFPNIFMALAIGQIANPIEERTTAKALTHPTT